MVAIHILREFKANSYRLPGFYLGEETGVVPGGKAGYVRGRLDEFIDWDKSFESPSWHSQLGITPIGELRPFESTNGE